MLINLLILTLFVPLLGLCSVLCIDTQNEDGIKNVSLWVAIFAFVLSLVSCFFVNKSIYIDAILLILHISKLSLYFMTIVSFAILASIFVGKYECNVCVKSFNASIIGIETLSFILFSNDDVIMFYICLMMIVIITFILLRHFASELARKIFTIQSIGVLLLFCGIVYIVNITGASDIVEISHYTFSLNQERIIFWTIMPAFIAMSFMFSFHSKMLDALSSMPTSTSIIVSDVCMKLSAFGVIFVVLPIVPHACAKYQMLITSICVFSIFGCVIEMMFFQNLRHVVAEINIAISSIILLGLFSLNTAGESGTLLCVAAYVITTIGLYLFVYCIDKYNIDCSIKTKGLIYKMPVIAMCAELSILSIGAIPLLPCFFGEVALVMAYFDEHIILCCLLCAALLAFNFFAFAVFQKTIFGEKLDRVTISKQDIFMSVVISITVLTVGLSSTKIQNFTASAINDSRVKDLYKNVEL